MVIQNILCKRFDKKYFGLLSAAEYDLNLENSSGTIQANRIDQKAQLCNIWLKWLLPENVIRRSSGTWDYSKKKYEINLAKAIAVNMRDMSNASIQVQIVLVFSFHTKSKKWKFLVQFNQTNKLFWPD